VKTDYLLGLGCLAFKMHAGKSDQSAHDFTYSAAKSVSGMKRD